MVPGLQGADFGRIRACFWTERHPGAAPAASLHRIRGEHQNWALGKEGEQHCVSPAVQPQLFRQVFEAAAARLEPALICKAILSCSQLRDWSQASQSSKSIADPAPDTLGGLFQIKYISDITTAGLAIQNPLNALRGSESTSHAASPQRRAAGAGTRR